jgi:hypothetical protein
MSAKGPHFIVIGAQKAGSSFVQDALRAHPEIYMPYGESSLFSQEQTQQIEKELDQIARRGSMHKSVGIKRPDYLADVTAASRIRDLLPSVRLIAIIRDPVDRAISALYHYMLHGLIPVVTPDEAFEDLLCSRSIEHYPRSAEILEYGFYAKHLNVYMDLFPRSQIQVTVYDELRSSPDHVMQGLFDFVGVDSTAAVQPRRSNPTVYSLKRIRLIRAAAAPWGERLKDKSGGVVHLPGAIRALQTADSVLAAALNGRPKPEISSEVRQRLYALYQPDVLQLRDNLGLDVSRWLPNP